MRAGTIKQVALQEGIMDGLKKIGSSLRKAFFPNDKEKIAKALRIAKREGNRYDIHFITMLQDLMKKADKGTLLSTEDEAMIHLLRKAYIELPDQISSLESQRTVAAIGTGVNDMFRNSELRRTKEELRRYKINDEINRRARYYAQYGNNR